VFHWHADSFELPAGAVLLATSDAYERQAFRVGESAYGLQFHAETSVELVRGMIELPATAAQLARIPGADGRRLLPEAAKQMPSINALGRHLITRWLGLCGARSAPSPAPGPWLEAPRGPAPTSRDLRGPAHVRPRAPS
jgi:GMP synthase (glutamine-hydrolysing)